MEGGVVVVVGGVVGVPSRCVALVGVRNGGCGTGDGDGARPVELSVYRNEETGQEAREPEYQSSLIKQPDSIVAEEVDEGQRLRQTTSGRRRGGERWVGTDEWGQKAEAQGTRSRRRAK